MSEFTAVTNLNRCPSHPGALLSEVIPATGKTKVELANLPGISRQQLYDIMNERKPVSPSIAARLALEVLAFRVQTANSTNWDHL